MLKSAELMELDMVKIQPMKIGNLTDIQNINLACLNPPFSPSPDYKNSNSLSKDGEEEHIPVRQLSSDYQVVENQLLSSSRGHHPQQLQKDLKINLHNLPKFKDSARTNSDLSFPMSAKKDTDLDSFKGCKPKSLTLSEY